MFRGFIGGQPVLSHSVRLGRDADEPRNPFLIRCFFLRSLRSGSVPLAAVLLGKVAYKAQRRRGIMGEILVTGGVSRLGLRQVSIPTQ